MVVEDQVGQKSSDAEGEGEGQEAAGGGNTARRRRIEALKQELVGGDLLTAAEVAEILDIHPRTVSEYIRDGKLQAYQFGGAWKISENALRAFVHGQTRRCSFCGKSNAQVRRLIAGPNGAYICDGCVEMCNEIIATETAALPTQTT